MYDGLGFVTDFMNWIVSSSWKGVVVMLITNPLTMTIIAGLVFEGRMVKLWHGQSRSFFPGDLFLALAAIMAVVANSRMAASDLPEAFMDFWENKGAIIAFFIALIVLWLIRKVYDAPAYSRTTGATANSATKWAHDFFWLLVVPVISNNNGYAAGGGRIYGVRQNLCCYGDSVWSVDSRLGLDGCTVGPQICGLHAGYNAS